MAENLKPRTLAGSPSMPPVVFLHGFMGEAEDWRPVAEALGADFHVLAINLPGHGPDCQEVSPDTMDPATCAARMVKHVNNLGLERPGMVGYSMGGRIALYLALHHPESVGRLVLESASPGLADEEKRESRRASDEKLAQRLAAMEAGSEEFRSFLEDWYRLPLFASLRRHRNVLANVMERRCARCHPPALAGALRSLGTGIQPSLWEDLRHFSVPTLLIAGEMDRKFRIIAEDMALACPAMAAEILSGCGHNVHLENPEAFVTVVRAFLKPSSG